LSLKASGRSSAAVGSTLEKVPLGSLLSILIAFLTFFSVFSDVFIHLLDSELDELSFFYLFFPTILLPSESLEDEQEDDESEEEDDDDEDSEEDSFFFSAAFEGFFCTFELLDELLSLSLYTLLTFSTFFGAFLTSSLLLLLESLLLSTF